MLGKFSNNCKGLALLFRLKFVPKNWVNFGHNCKGLVLPFGLKFVAKIFGKFLTKFKGVSLIIMSIICTKNIG